MGEPNSLWFWADGAQTMQKDQNPTFSIVCVVCRRGPMQGAELRKIRGLGLWICKWGTHSRKEIRALCLTDRDNDAKTDTDNEGVETHD